MENILIKEDGTDYSGKFVATKSFNDKEVVASGRKASSVIRKAKKKGYDSPVIFFVPKRIPYIYKEVSVTDLT